MASLILGIWSRSLLISPTCGNLASFFLFSFSVLQIMYCKSATCIIHIPYTQLTEVVLELVLRLHFLGRLKVELKDNFNFGLKSEFVSLLHFSFLDINAKMPEIGNFNH